MRAVAVKLSQRRGLNQAITAADISQVCLDEDIAIPGVNMEEQTIEQAPMQIGRIMKPLFKDVEEVTFDEFRIVHTTEEVVNQGSGNLYESNRYTFSLVTATPETPAPQGAVEASARNP